MPQIGQPNPNQLALTKTIESQRDILARMLHPALAEQHERLVEFALAALRNPQIAACTPESIILSLHTSAKLGLLPDGVEGAIVPRKKAGVPEAQFEAMYQGLVKAYLRTGKVKRVWAEKVLKGEKFSVHGGSNPRIEHELDMTLNRESWDDLVCTYAIAEFMDGTQVYFPCSKAELERIRANAPENGPWKNHPVAMAWKTPLKRLRKLVPLEPELQRVLAQQEAEEGSVDIEGTVVGAAPTTLEGVLGIDTKPAPPEVWYFDIRIEEKYQRFDEWKAQLTGSKHPKLATISWAQLAECDAKDELVPLVEAMLKDAAARQADKGAVGEPFQRAAVAWWIRRQRLEEEAAKAAGEPSF